MQKENLIIMRWNVFFIALMFMHKHAFFLHNLRNKKAKNDNINSHKTHIAYTLWLCAWMWCIENNKIKKTYETERESYLMLIQGKRAILLKKVELLPYQSLKTYTDFNRNTVQQLNYLLTGSVVHQSLRQRISHSFHN